MPELPEVESLRRDLQATMTGRSIVAVETRLPKLFVQDWGLGPDDLRERSVVRIDRRAKFLLVRLSGDVTMIVHLRLAGQLAHRGPDDRDLAHGGHPVPAFHLPLPHKQTQLILELDDGSRVYLTDIRQFGRVWVMPDPEVGPFLAAGNLGPEPLSDEFSHNLFVERLARRRRALLKPLLLDQTFVGGIGNIYADEIAFSARLSPVARVGELSPAQQEALFLAIRYVLKHAVTNGVAEILNGRANPATSFPLVHGRAGSRCTRCGTPIVKTRVVGRGTYVCPSCQGYSA
ncbi:MAG: Fpg/Nei family DNA glycosylase [Chloroflexi bacterium]|nr:Fpg/Nei family DNA glycosylase [Chloroflexota bacterium]